MNNKISDAFYETELAMKELALEADNFREKVKAGESGGAFFSSLRLMGAATRILSNVAVLAQETFNIYVTTRNS